MLFSGMRMPLTYPQQQPEKKIPTPNSLSQKEGGLVSLHFL